MADKPKDGDTVLVYGKRLEVTEVVDRWPDHGSKPVVVCEEPGLREEREAAQQEERDLISGTQWKAFVDDEDGTKAEKTAAYEAKLREIQKRAGAAIFRLKLRVDLLSFWEEVGVWVSDGRILSDDQSAEWKAKYGKKPKGVVTMPSGEVTYPEREAYLMLTKEA